MHKAIIAIGSNIDPVENMQRAIESLHKLTTVQSISTIWETKAEGSPGPDFLNAAVSIVTDLEAAELKIKVLGPIEQKLGRERTSDKNAPRTIDLDLIIFDGIVCDASLWTRLYIALPVSELTPEITDPESNRSLKEIARELQKGSHPNLKDG
jgi:2-amino-4-hydroxy-6-hydroxymethyldihydropteridine diphosphokinase